MLPEIEAGRVDLKLKALNAFGEPVFKVTDGGPLEFIAIPKGKSVRKGAVRFSKQFFLRTTADQLALVGDIKRKDRLLVEGVECEVSDVEQEYSEWFAVELRPTGVFSER